MTLSSPLKTTALAAIIALTACTTATMPNTETSSSSSASSASSDITVSQPAPNSSTSSPLTVTGEARGTWYFEASFPVRLYDASNNLLAEVPAQAQSDWMTTDFVPFVATLTYTVNTPQTGTLVLSKDNPSGEPQNDASISIPVQLNP